MIARRLKLATESETLSRPLRMEAEADLELRAVRPLEMEPADQAAGLLLDRDVTVASRRRVEELGEIIPVLGRPVVERERVGVMPVRDHLRVRLAHRPETERHHGPSSFHSP